MDFEEAGLLDGLEGKEREARQRLLQRLLDDGASADELKQAVAEDRLALLPVERVLRGSQSAREVEERTGLSADEVLRIRHALGLSSVEPDERVFTDEDIEATEAVKRYLDAGFDADSITQITRVLGEAMSRLAATTTAAFAETFLEPGDTEEDVALRFAALAEQFVPALTPVLLSAFRAHLREVVSRGMLGSEERSSGQLAGAQELAVCFADLVGFTRLGGQLDVRELGTVAGRLSDLATEAAESPVRLVKTIGDAAMFVSDDRAAMVAAALWLVDAAAEAELPALRAGIAYGPTQPRSGDFFGHAVNLSSRVTGVARPGSVLCTQEVRDAAEDKFTWSSAGRHRLKGIKQPVPLYRARSLEKEGSSAEEADRPARKQREDRRRR